VFGSRVTWLAYRMRPGASPHLADFRAKANGALRPSMDHGILLATCYG